MHSKTTQIGPMRTARHDMLTDSRGARDAGFDVSFFQVLKIIGSELLLSGGGE